MHHLKKLGLWFSTLRTRLYYVYTQWHSRLKEPKVRPAANYGEIVVRLAYGSEYKPDKRFDNMTHPRKIQRRIDEGNVLLGDCDDHAAYWLAVLHRSNLADEAYFGNIQYRSRGKHEGHAVTVFQYEGQWYWADYGMPLPIDARDHWAKSVLAVYGDEFISAYLLKSSITENDTLEFSDPVLYLDMPK